MISKTREKAGIFSRDSAFIEYDMGSKDPIIGNQRPIGGVNIDQRRKGVDYPNVQSALDDLYTLSMIRVGDVLVSTNSTPPNPNGQIETLTFTGTVKNSKDESLPKAIVHVYGIPFVLDKGKTHIDLTKAVTEKFTEMMKRNEMFSNVRVYGSTNNQLEIKFLDTITHPEETVTENGITISRSITSPAQTGYGAWSLLGTETKFNTTLYYFKRIA